MVHSIPHRELRNNSSAVLREVQAGEVIEITNHGEVVAVLVPTSHSPVPRLRPATRRGGFADLPRVRLDHPIQQSLDDLRGER